MISVVVPTFNEEGNIAKLYERVARYLKSFEFEIIYIDDGSSDSSLDKIKALADKHSNVRYVSFSRNFGHQAALRAGLAQAQGDAIISMDADLQHPPRLLPVLIEQWQKGYQVVYTVREEDENLGVVKRITSKYFYRLMNFLSDLNIEAGAADFRLLDRKVVDVVNQQQETGLFMRGYINWIGFKQIGIPYHPDQRFSGQSKYTFKKMISFASSGVTQFSIKPLKFAHLLASLAFLLSFAYIVYAILTAINGHAIPGWLSLVVLFVFLQGVQFMLLGMIGEYLGRTFMQTKGRPEYIIIDSNIEKPVDKR